MLAFLNAKRIAYIVGALLIVGLLLGIAKDIGDRRENELTIKAVIQAQHKERAINEKTYEAAKAKAKAVSSVREQHSSLVSSLQERPSRYSSAPSSGASSTGRELYREDAEFLAGEAARAERILIERNYYYERYEEARKELASQ